MKDNLIVREWNVIVSFVQNIALNLKTGKLATVLGLKDETELAVNFAGFILSLK